MEETVSEAYKIRCKRTGLFSGAGRDPHFAKEGATWYSWESLVHHLKSVQGNVLHNRVGSIYRDCEIVEYEVTETRSTPVVDWITEDRRRGNDP